MVLAVAMVAACSSDTDEPAAGAGSTTTSSTSTSLVSLAPAWPVPDWQTIDPADAGLEPSALSSMAAHAAAGGTSCLVVTRDGRLVDEHYWNGASPTSEQEAFSVTKSITSTLVGIAADRGLLDIDQPASTFIPEWKGTPSEPVTVRNLLAMDSGRRQDFKTDYSEMAARAADKTAFSIALDQEHPPGTFWAYNNAGVQDLERVLEVATGGDVGEFARTALFEPLGMTSHIRRDDAGNTLTFMGAQASCRDLARFGLLHLRMGEWAGRQIVSRDWVTAATSPSQELNDRYGLLWWLGEDQYAAIGMFHQLVVVFPESGIVVTRMGAGQGSGGDQFRLDDLVRGIRNALGAG